MDALKTGMLAAALALTAAAPRTARAELKVIATVPDLAALAREVGAGLTAVRAMSLATQDPHFVDAKPSLVLEVNRADLLLLVGMDLEVGWLPTLLVGARNPAVQIGGRGHLDCAQFVRRLDARTGPIDRSMGDIHAAGNPHYLSDPRAAAAVARGIAERLAELDPQHAPTYRSNLTAFLQRLESAQRGWEAKMAPHRGAPLVAYHKTLTYLADWLALKEAGFLEPKPGIPPNPSHVAQLLVTSRLRKVRAVVVEEKYPDAAARLVADKIPAPLVRIPGGTNFQGGQRYLDYLDELIKRLSGGLAGAGGN